MAFNLSTLPNTPVIGSLPLSMTEPERSHGQDVTETGLSGEMITQSHFIAKVSTQMTAFGFGGRKRKAALTDPFI